MPIKLIHGFLKEKQQANPEWGSISIIETVLIEMDSVASNTVEILTLLPAAPNTVTSWNPKGISFTFDISVHPDSNVFVLRKAGTLQDVGGGFWEIQLTYAIFSHWELTGPAISSSGGGGTGNTNPKQRKDQREVTNPLLRAPVWNTSSTIVQKETYKRPDGVVIRHTNGLPLTTPYSKSEVHQIHTYSYNTDFTAFNYTFYDDFIGKVNNAICLGKPIGTLKLSAFSASEEYESIGQGVTKTEYHYVRLTMSFEYNPSGWIEDAKLVSMSTLQLIQQIVFPFLVFYDRIRISEIQYAQEPWPLDANGVAIPWNNNLPANYGYVDHGYPLLANLNTVTAVRGLAIP